MLITYVYGFYQLKSLANLTSASRIHIFQADLHSNFLTNFPPEWIVTVVPDG